jgi:hypothetical protein
MTDPKKPKDEIKNDPALKDVEPGSDADATPDHAPGDTPPDRDDAASDAKSSPTKAAD